MVEKYKFIVYSIMFQICVHRVNSYGSPIWWSCIQTGSQKGDNGETNLKKQTNKQSGQAEVAAD
jgi:hypothetical protein